MSTGDLSGRDSATGGGGNSEVEKLEATVASLTKQNTKLKNELRFTTETERRTSGECIENLQREIESLQSRNEQVSSALLQVEVQLKGHEISQAKLEAAQSAKMAAQSAALVERLSSAQRERERILASQLRQVMDEKQQLMKKLQDNGLEISLNSDNSESTDDAAIEKSGFLEIATALETAKGSFELQQQGDRLVKRLKEVRDEQRTKIQDQMDMLKWESQEAMNKKKTAEGQIGRLKQQLEMLKTEYKLVDKTRIKSLQSQLQAAVTEKDNWQKKAEKFEDTCETLRVLSSLQKSMSKEEEIKRKYEGELRRYHNEVEQLTQQASQIMQERNQLVLERSQIILQCQQEYERAERLQRLVVVLRRKVGNTSASLNSSDRRESHSSVKRESQPSNTVYDI